MRGGIKTRFEISPVSAPPRSERSLSMAKSKLHKAPPPALAKEEKGEGKEEEEEEKEGKEKKKKKKKKTKRMKK